MLDVQLGELIADGPAGVGEALALVAGFDDALGHGFARLAEEDAAALAALAGALAGSPLGDRLGEAVEKVAAGTVADEHLAALAGGRAALFGAVHDALLARLDHALGRTRAEWPSTAPVDPASHTNASETAGGAGSGAAQGTDAADAALPGTRADVTGTGAEAGDVAVQDERAEAGDVAVQDERAEAGDVAVQDEGAAAGDVAGIGEGAVEGVAVPENFLAGCRVWLRELAITGWRGVDHDLVSGADQAIEALLAVPRLRGLAVLLDGLAAELRASSPVATMDRLPARRWADLWTRGLVLARSGPWNGAPRQVSGRLLILGADVHEHATVVRVQVHGILEEPGGQARLVRTSVAAAKVDTIVGPSVWRLLGGHPVLLGALAERRAVEIDGMPLLPGGDLVWHDGRARAGKEADPFATARVRLAGALAPAVPPLDRHPVRIAEPVFVEGYKIDGLALDLGGHRITLDLDRLPSSCPLTPELVAASSACIGLVRWDGGGWLLQPLAVQATVKKKPVTVHNGDWAAGPTDPKVVKAEAKAGDVVAVLRERAGRLLRK